MAAPSWSDAISVVALQKVAAGAKARGVLNVQNKFGGYLFVRAMRLSSSAPSSGLYVAIRRILKGTPAGGGAGVDITHPKGFSITDGTTASNLTTLSATPTIPVDSVSLTSGTGFAGGQHVGIVDSVSAPTIFETARTSKISGTTLTLDRNLTNSGIASGATITNQAFILPPYEIAGAPDTAEIELIFDLGLEATVAYAVEAWAQTLDSVA